MNNFIKLLLDCIRTSSVTKDLSYGELLKKKEWKDKRLKILRRDKYTCQYCHKKKKYLQVHHLYYLVHEDGRKALPWEYKDSALITLCKSCHEMYHKLYKPEWFKIK